VNEKERECDKTVDVTSPIAESQRLNVAISIIVPFLNEAESLAQLIKETQQVLRLFPDESELIFVDDGSTDEGDRHIIAASELDSRIKLITFRKNFGQTAAWAAGIEHAKGDVLVFLDADLQNDPKDIPMLVKKITDEGYDVASGWRKDRKDPFWSRTLPSWMANRLISIITRVKLHDYGCSLKAYRREVIQDVRIYGEMHRFLPAHAAWEGAKIVELPVNHRGRRFGTSKYGLIRTFKVLLDLVTVVFLGSFSTKPLYFFGCLGGGALFLGVTTFAIVAYRVLILHHKEATPLVFMMVIFFITAVQFILMGLLAEIAVRIYHEAQGKPVYRVRGLKNIEPVRARRYRR